MQELSDYICFSLKTQSMYILAMALDIFFFQPKSTDIFLFLYVNICCGHLLEVPSEMG